MKIVSALVCLAFTVMVRANDTVTVRLQLEEITATEKVYNFTFENFDGIIAYQWALSFDPAGMSFKEARNITLEHLLPSDFHESTPGVLRSLYLNPTLEGADHPDVFTAFQLVFEVNTTGGSDVCLSETSIDYEFVALDGVNEFTMNTLVMYDDCHQPFVLALSPTAVKETSYDGQSGIERVYGNSDGWISFVSQYEGSAHLTVFDYSGREVSRMGRQFLTKGRHDFQTGQPLTTGVYLLTVWTEQGAPYSVPFSIQ